MLTSTCIIWAAFINCLKTDLGVNLAKSNQGLSLTRYHPTSRQKYLASQTDRQADWQNGAEHRISRRSPTTTTCNFYLICPVCPSFCLCCNAQPWEMHDVKSPEWSQAQRRSSSHNLSIFLSISMYIVNANSDFAGKCLSYFPGRPKFKKKHIPGVKTIRDIVLEWKNKNVFPFPGLMETPRVFHYLVPFLAE